MADVQEIEWPSFETVLRELAPERVEAREQRKRELAAIAAEEALAGEAALKATPDELAAVVSDEVSGAVSTAGVANFLQEDPFSETSIEQSEFSGVEVDEYIIDLNNPGPTDFIVSPEEAAQERFITLSEPESVETPGAGAPAEQSPIAYAPGLEPDLAVAEPVDAERAPLTSLFNHAGPELLDDETAAQEITRPEPESQPTAQAARNPFGTAADVDLVPPAPSAEDLTTPLEEAGEEPTIDLSEQDPWAEMRPDAEEDVAKKKIVFWADRPKFFGGDERHKARARRAAREQDENQ